MKSVHEFIDTDDVIPLSAKHVQAKVDGPCNEGQWEVQLEGWLTSGERPWGTWAQLPHPYCSDDADMFHALH